MAEFDTAAQQIGFMLGGGGKQMREKAYDEGRLNTAKTEEALANARKTQLEATAKANAERAAEKFKTDYINIESGKGRDPKVIAQEAELIGNLMIAGTGADFYSIQQGRGEQQEQGFRGILADVESPAETRLQAGHAIQGKVSPDIAPVGTHGVVDLTLEDQELIPTLGSGTPAIKNYLFNKPLPPEEQEAFSPFVRADQIVSPGGVPYVRPVAGDRTPKPVVPREEVAANVATIAAEKKLATERATAQAGLRDSLANIDKMSNDINALLQEPGFSTIYGLSSTIDPRVYIRGTAAANAEAKRKNIDAQAFGVSIQQMRGLGQLSNAEGLKVTDAFTTATNPAMSDEAARTAWGTVLETLSLARLRAIEKAFNPDLSQTLEPGSFGVSQPGAAAPQGEAIEDIIVNEGLGEYNDAGDLVDGRGWTFEKDAEGNAAWVSPDRTQYEEVAQ